MRKSLFAFFAAVASFLVFLWGFTEALKFTPFARLAFLRLLLIAGGLGFFCLWLARIVWHSRLVPEPLRIRVQKAVRAIPWSPSWFLFSPRFGLSIACVAFVFVSVFSIWYTSLGLFPHFPEVGNLYIDQANAFLKGQLSLIETPSFQILALSDPYSFEKRAGLSYLWDASLYHGKYYLYWGPVPASMLAVIMALTGGKVPDSLLVVLSTIGISAIIFVLLWKIRKRFYPQAPAIFISLFLLVTTINMPYLFLLGRGRVYETSIITGQFFLLLGLAGYFYYRESDKPGWLFLAGLSWGLSIACRYNMAVSVAVFLAFGFWMIWKSSNGSRALFRKSSYLIIPLAVCMLGLGIFNWMRFGNPLETGLNYQLTAPVNQNQHFSLAYLRTNIYLNVLYPYRKVELFPLIRSIAVVPERAPAWVNYNLGKRAEETTFSLRLLPIFWLVPLLLPISGVFWWMDRRRVRQSVTPAGAGLSQFIWMIGLAGFIQFFLLQLYYYSAVRFMADFYLSWMLVGVILLWSLDRRLMHHPWLRILLWTVAILAIVATVLLGFLAGFDNPPRVFEIYNPVLEAQIAAAWNSVYGMPGLLGKSLRYLLGLFL